jgi:hypothetical protein
MARNNRTEWVGIYRDMTDDAKIAYVNGDLTLQDILGDTSELQNSTKIKLDRAIRTWYGTKTESIGGD